MAFSIDLDYEMVDKIIWKGLEESRDSLTKDLGANNHVFVWGDQEADDIEIQKHIDALNLIIEWYRIPE
jgi:hypothetical protein